MTEKKISKLEKIFNKMHEALNGSFYMEYQKRFHRLQKTIGSIEKHNNIVVSTFIPEIKPLDYSHDDYEKNYQTFNSHLTFDESETDFAVESNKDGQIVTGYKLKLDELLDYLENQLFSKSTSKETDDDSSGFDSSGKEDKGKQTENFKELKQKDFKKLLFNIEVRIKAYLKEQECQDIFNTQFDSFLKTEIKSCPIEKPFYLKELPSSVPMIKKKFFDEKEVEEIKKKANIKRKSLHPVKIHPGLFNMESIIDSFNKCKSGYNVMKYDYNVKANIPDFDPMIGENEKKVKRGSIFKNTFVVDFEKLDVDKIDEDDDDSGSDDSQQK